MYVHVYVHVCVHVYVHVHVYVRVHVYVHVCVCAPVDGISEGDDVAGRALAHHLVLACARAIYYNLGR